MFVGQGDTHAFLWLLAGDTRLRPSARRRIEDPRNDVFLSVASVWEMAIKISLGKLELGEPLGDVLDVRAREAGIAVLAISKDHALQVARLPWHHRNPFDRMLAAQALEEKLTLVTRDRVFAAYGVARAW